MFNYLLMDLQTRGRSVGSDDDDAEDGGGESLGINDDDAKDGGHPRDENLFGSDEGNRIHPKTILLLQCGETMK